MIVAKITCALMWIMPGSKKARVLPLPVAEIPIMSLPSSAMGHPWDWMGVAARQVKTRQYNTTEYNITGIV
jgi:hypothetical protein